MKIIWYDPHIKRWASQKPIFLVLPDTCLLLRNRPYYLPDPQSDYQAQAAWMVRIDRLGKHIEARFASRYYQSICLGFKIIDQSALLQCRQDSLPWECAFARDESLGINTFETIKLWSNTSPSLLHNAQEHALTLETALAHIDSAIEAVSQYITLRTGDIIAIATACQTSSLHIGDCLTIKGLQPITCHIK